MRRHKRQHRRTLTRKAHYQVRYEQTYPGRDRYRRPVTDREDDAALENVVRAPAPRGAGGIVTLGDLIGSRFKLSREDCGTGTTQPRAAERPSLAGSVK